jgi:8-oxo-dGTP pyrophosphatase MutT (NUDIX family)
LLAVTDWKARIAERLARSVPRHSPQDWLLPGLSPEETQALEHQFPQSLIAAAVLVPLVERARELTVLLTKRAIELKSHAGQISFPGGRLEGEESPRAAALREAREEIGLEARFVDIAGYLGGPGNRPSGAIHPGEGVSVTCIPVREVP